MKPTEAGRKLVDSWGGGWQGKRVVGLRSGGNMVIAVGLAKNRDYGMRTLHAIQDHQSQVTCDRRAPVGVDHLLRESHKTTTDSRVPRNNSRLKDLKGDLGSTSLN